MFASQYLQVFDLLLSKATKVKIKDPDLAHASIQLEGKKYDLLMVWKDRKTCLVSNPYLYDLLFNNCEFDVYLLDDTLDLNTFISKVKE